jgi:hypothetical protein
MDSTRSWQTLAATLTGRRTAPSRPDQKVAPIASPKLSGRGVIPSRLAVPAGDERERENLSLAGELVTARPEKTGTANRIPIGVDRTIRLRIDMGSRYLYLSCGDNRGRN